MRAIAKSREPESLTAHRWTPYSDYDNYPSKSDLREALVTEQRGLCCYCMGGIRAGRTTMKIEHWKCRSRYPDKQLEYRNLLGACLGGVGKPFRLQHCDTRKRERDLGWNPADSAHHIETRIRYELDGSIHAYDDDFESQLNNVLNLNISVLKNIRKGILDGIINWWEFEKDRIGVPVPRDSIVRKRDEQIAGNGKLDPHCQVAVWWLEQGLAGVPV